MNKKILILSILSLNLASNFTFAANWSAPAGYEKITNPSYVKYYSNIIKAPNGVDLYGKKLSVYNNLEKWSAPAEYEKITSPSKIKNYSNIIKAPNGVDLYGKKVVVNNNIANNKVSNEIKYLDKNNLLYYKGLLVQGSIDKQYYYVNTSKTLYVYNDFCEEGFSKEDICPRAYLKAVSSEVIKSGSINTKNALIVDQELINKTIAQLPITKKDNIDLIGNYKVCDFKNNIFNLITKDKKPIASVSVFEGDNGKKTGDLSIANIIDIDCMKNGGRLQKQECMKFESNGYKRISSVYCAGGVSFCLSVYEKNNKFYLIDSSGGYMNPANISNIYVLDSLNNICK